MHPPDPEMRRASFTRNEASPEVGKSKKQKQRYSISLETQAAFWVLLPTLLAVVLLAIAGAWHER
jgi:hypothetical protein